MIEAAARDAAACLVLEAARPGGGVVTGRGAVGAMRVVATGSGRHVTDPGRARQCARAARRARRADRGARRRTTAVWSRSEGSSPAPRARSCPTQGELLIDLRARTTEAAEELAAGASARWSPQPHAVSGVTLAVEGGVTRPAWPRDAGRRRLYSLAAAARRGARGSRARGASSAAAPTRRWRARPECPRWTASGPSVTTRAAATSGSRSRASRGGARSSRASPPGPLAARARRPRRDQPRPAAW